MTGLVLLEELELENNQLSFTPSMETSLIDKVKTMTLSGMNSSNSANLRSMSGLTNLTSLNLKGNKVETIPIKAEMI